MRLLMFRPPASGNSTTCFAPSVMPSVGLVLFSETRERTAVTDTVSVTLPTFSSTGTRTSVDGGTTMSFASTVENDWSSAFTV